MPTRTPSAFLAVIAAGIALAACHPGNDEAKRLRGSCEAGDIAACNKFALKLPKGEYVLRDEAHAAELFDRACNGGVGEGCASLGVVYQNGTGVKRDSARAFDLFGQGCDRGAMDGCTRLGVLYAQGAGVPKDVARAAALFSRRATAAT